jgi:glycosyltransferase involved in cell wall biosynthesis
MPEVSIITSTYNRPKELERAIKSVDAQSFTDWEHIIVHDGTPSKETHEIIKKYTSDKRTFYALPKNYGNHTKPKNEGIKQAKGEYICYLDDDCEYMPNFVDTLKLELELSGVDVVYGDERMFKDEKDRRGEPAISLDFSGQFLLKRSFIDTNVAFHRREAVFDIGGWDETLPRFADWNLFVRMAKWGKSFKHVPIFVTRYYITKGNSAERFPVDSWVEEGLTMFDPTWFNPSSCYIYLPYLGNDKEEEKNPKVAIFTVTYDRLEYTKKMYESMRNSMGRDTHWFVYDNGSTDGTQEYLKTLAPGAITARLSGTKKDPYLSFIELVELSTKNKGLTHASNKCVDKIMEGNYQIIGKVDNDCMFLTKGWLEEIVDLWKRNHKLYMAPYPEGLVDHPGGTWRVGYASIGDEYVEVVRHLSGLCAFVDSRAYRNFRWKDKFLHGQQDVEASTSFTEQGYMPIIIPRHRVQHMDTTAGQQKKYPEYFARRKQEKKTQV